MRCDGYVTATPQGGEPRVLRFFDEGMIPPRIEYMFGSVQSLEHLHGGEDSELLRRMLIAYQYHIIRLLLDP